MNEKVNLEEKLRLLERPYGPGIFGYLNDYKLAVVKICGEFVWHWRLARLLGSEPRCGQSRARARRTRCEGDREAGGADRESSRDRRVRSSARGAGRFGELAPAV